MENSDMRPPDNQIDRLFDNLKLTTSASLDHQIELEIEQALKRHDVSSKPAAKQGLWSMMMNQPKIKITAALIAVVCIALAFVFVDKSPSPAYAIEQSVEAINAIKSVHFKAEFYKQGPVECWMQFDNPRKGPSHICLFLPGSPLRKIDIPEGNWLYNSVTNRKFKTLRDERRKQWYLDFASFFRDSLSAAARNDQVAIETTTDPESQKDRIVVRVTESDRTCEYTIDPVSKLPLEFTSSELEPEDLNKWMRKTIAVKNMSFIEYNQPVPPGIFSFPDDAEEVNDEIDIIIEPGKGMAIPEGMTEPQACRELFKAVVAAMNAFDFERVSQLYFPFVAPPKPVVDKLRSDAAGQPMIEILEIGEPYQKDNYWFLPNKVREFSGKLKTDEVRIKFFEFNHQRYCMVAFPD